MVVCISFARYFALLPFERPFLEAAARRLGRPYFSTMLPWLYFARCHAAVTRALTCFLPYPVEFQALSLRIGQGPVLIRHEADRSPRSLLLAPLPCSGGGADPPGVSNQTPAAPAQESLTLPFRVIVIFPRVSRPCFAPSHAAAAMAHIISISGVVLHAGKCFCSL